MRLDRILQELLPKCQVLYPNLLEEKLSDKILDCVLMIAFLNPTHDIEEPVMRIITLFCFLGFAMDDLADGNGKPKQNIIENFLSYKKFVELWNWAVLHRRFLPFIPKHFPIVSSTNLDALTKFSTYFLAELADCNPEIYQKLFSGVCADAVYLTVGTVILEYEMKCKKIELSTESNTIIYRYSNGMEGYAEFIAVCFCPELDTNVRRDILFHLLMSNFSLICVHLNAMFGLKRDIETNLNSPIMNLVKTNQISLQEAFNVSQETANNAYVDFLYSAGKICEAYKDNIGVEKFVENLMYILDGSLHACGRLRRYKLRDLRFIIKS